MRKHWKRTGILWTLWMCLLALAWLNACAASDDFAGVLGQTITFRAVDQANLSFGGPGPDSGREAQVDVDFPEGDWVKVEVTLTLNSHATSGICMFPNPTGDIYDRSASIFLILDESCRDGFRCMGSDGQVELMKAVTPFGTDERTGPRVLTYDITPLAPLLVGTRPLGVWVDTYDTHGWWVDVDFTFTADPKQASPKPPADGIQPVFFKQRVTAEDQPGIQPVPVTIPDDAQQVFIRLFSTGHGAVGQPPCDEFCQRVNRILVEDQPTWQQVVWRTDCAFNQEGESCHTWNACGYPSCTFSRSGWCPGYIACQQSDPCDQDLDATAWLPPGGTYDVLYNIQNLTPGGAYWNYSLVVYWYK